MLVNILDFRINNIIQTEMHNYAGSCELELNADKNSAPISLGVRLRS